MKATTESEPPYWRIPAGPVQAFVRRALNKSPDQRFQTASEMAAALQALSAPPSPNTTYTPFHQPNVGNHGPQIILGPQARKGLNFNRGPRTYFFQDWSLLKRAVVGYAAFFAISIVVVTCKWIAQLTWVTPRQPVETSPVQSVEDPAKIAKDFFEMDEPKKGQPRAPAVVSPADLRHLPWHNQTGVRDSVLSGSPLASRSVGVSHTRASSVDHTRHGRSEPRRKERPAGTDEAIKPRIKHPDDPPIHRGDDDSG